MFTKLHWIDCPNLDVDQIAISARPRGCDWLEDEIRAFKFTGITTVVSLLESNESWELGLDEEKEFCERFQIGFLQFPIVDVNVPRSDEKYVELCKNLCQKIDDGERILIHCRMGIGRSSMLAASLALKYGCEEETVFDKIRKNRGLEVPDTQEQREYVMKINGEWKRT